MTAWITERTDITVSSGSTTVGSVSTGQLDADNIRIDGNTISSTDTNGNIALSPDGTGGIGVGIASPANRLHLENGGLAITGGTAVGASEYVSRILVNSGGSTGHTLCHLLNTEETIFKAHGATGTIGKIGIGLTTPTSKLHIDQSATAGAMPVLRLDQGDADETFIDFIGTSAADGAANISSDTTTDSAKFGAIRIEINGVHKWIRIYDDHS